MSVNELFSRFPLKMTVEAEAGPRNYIREDDCFAIHGPMPSGLTATVLYSFADPEVHVCRGDGSLLSTLPPGLVVTPVYRLEMHGSQAVPTGKVFIRFRSEVLVERRQQEIQACGFSISDPLSYAPHAAWLQKGDGNIATALKEFAKLRTLPDVVLVEPQLLMRQVKR